MTNNLGRNEVTPTQNQKTVTINESDGILDAKLTDDFDADFTSGDVTMTDDEWQQNAAAICSNLGANQALNTPQQKGYLLVDNSSGGGFDVTVTRGSGTVVVPDTEVRLVYQDGTTNGIVNAGGGGGGLDVREGNVTVLDPTTILDFAAADFTVSDEGSGRALVALAAGAGGGGGNAPPGFSGALIRRDTDVAGNTSFAPIAWESAIFDDTFDPKDGGPAQRFWLGVNQTFVDGNVTVGTDVINITAHGFADGEGPVQLSNSGGALPTGLSTATNYWIIEVDANNIAFATSRANALADTRVNITAAAGGGTHSIDTETVLVVPAGVSKVSLVGQVDSQADLAGQLVVQITQNGTPTFPGAGATGVDTAGTEQAHTNMGPLTVNEGDRFELEDFGSDAYTIEGTDGRTWFGIKVEEADTNHVGKIARIGKNATQSITGTTDTVVTWQTTDIDDTIGGTSMIDLANDRFTIPAGVTRVRVRANILWTFPTTQRDLNVAFRLNGTKAFNGNGAIGYREITSSGSATSVMNVSSGVIEVVEGDDIDVEVRIGGTRNIEPDGQDRTWFEIEVVA